MLDYNAKPLAVSLPFTVKTYDIDFAGHVNNLVYIRWLEDLRFALLETHFPMEPMMKQGVAAILARTNIQYRRAIRLFEEVTGHMWVSSVGAARVVLEAHITSGSDVCADAMQEGVFVQLESGKPLRVPQEFRQIFDRATGR